MKTVTDIMNKAIKNVILQAKGKPYSVQKIAEMALEELNTQIKLENEKCVGVSRIKRVYELPEHVIAQLLIKLFLFCVLCRTQKLRSRSECAVAFFETKGDKKGLYVTDMDEIVKKITEFNRSLSKPQIRQVYDEILREAEVVYINHDPNLIPLNNGIFNYRNKKLMDYTRDKVFVSKFPVNYNPLRNTAPVYTNPDGTTWNVEDWLYSLSDDMETKNLLLQICGAIMRPNVAWEQILFLYSAVGRNGKGTFCVLLRELAGEGNYASISLKQMTQRFGLSQLLDASAIITDENSVQPGDIIKDIENVKAITTMDHIQLEQKYKNPIDFQFRGVIVQCLNSLPKFSDETSSMMRRMLFVDFPKTFTGCDNKAIKADYLHREDTLEYIVWRVLAGMPDYYEFSVPEASEELMASYKLEANLVNQFWNEFRDQFTWVVYPGQLLYDLYKAWAIKDMAVRDVEGKNKFLQALRRVVDDDAEWEYKTDSIPNNGYFKTPELLIGEYDLKQWMHPGYMGSSMYIRCTPPMPKSISSPFMRRRCAMNPFYQSND